ncbi:MAG: sensor histidine kinase N-terminal domain-containing protein [Ottowia sp.]|uniref:sensor histidine kinase n=1 Tax=Ottowia sp. TaxID=1898956 RepID=UPI003C76564E
MTRRSLKRTFLLWLALSLAVLVPLAAAGIYGLVLTPALDSLDRALTDTTVALSYILEDNQGQVSLPISEQTAQALRADLIDETVFSVTSPAGQLLGGSAELAALAPATPSGQWLFFERTLHDKPMRIAAYGHPCGSDGDICTILVAETMGKRDAAVRAALLGALLGALALALPLATLALLAINRVLRPLQHTADEMGRLSVRNLTPIDAGSVPSEVAGFVQALNALLARLQQAAGAQHAFVANAAHQLRTPWAIVRVEASELLASEHPPPMQPALERLHLAAERGSRLAQQLLSLARTESTALEARPPAELIDLRQLAAASADQWLHPALQAGQDLGFDLAPAQVYGHPVLLDELIGNLVHNAIVHAGQGARITVRTRTEGSVTLLAVEDDGPGVPAAEHEQLWQRFSRRDGASGTGSGLGLPIVADIAKLHGATAEIDKQPGAKGFCVRISFPTPAPAN